MKKKEPVEKRLIRSMSQAVEIAEGITAPSREYDLPLMTAKRVSVPPAPEYEAKSVIAIRHTRDIYTRFMPSLWVMTRRDSASSRAMTNGPE